MSGNKFVVIGKISQSGSFDSEKNEDETFCLFSLWLAKNPNIETSIFSDYENIILIFFDKVFLMLWCKSWEKVAHFFYLQK